MSINYFDIAIGIIVLLLGLKGLLNGFFKEVFGLIGIIGGIFVASRAGNALGHAISSHIASFTNETAIKFTGFLITFALFWLVMVAIGYTFKKLSNLSGLGPLDRILGFIVGGGKFFLIIAVITYAAYNIKIFRMNIQPIMKNSIVFPVLVATGSYIMKIEPEKTVQDINQTVSKTLPTVENNVSTAVQDVNKTVQKTVN
jgi:membrane protein required for colicin V production